MNKIAPYAKAIIAAVVTFLGALVTALDSGGISASEWLTALIAFLVAFGAVFSVPNRPPFISEDDVSKLQQQDAASGNQR